MCCLDFILFLDFGILTEVKLEEAVGGKVQCAQIVELLLLVSIDQYVHLEALQVLAELHHDIIQPDLAQFCFSKPLLVLVISFFLSPQMVGAHLFG